MNDQSLMMTVDLESLFHGHDMYCDLGGFRRQEADSGYSEVAVHAILELFNKHGVTATFFVVAEIYSWYPSLLDHIATAGHEIAFHTYDHCVIMVPEQLTEQIKKAKNFITTFKPSGFRAPFYKLPPSCLPLLKKWDFTYDSSLYGFNAPSLGEDLWTIPITLVPHFAFAQSKPLRYPAPLSTRQCWRGFPLGSGLSWGIPGFSMNRFIDKSLKLGVQPVLTIHPWQIEKPRYPYFLNRFFLVQRPWWYPYSRSITTKLVYVLRNYQFISIQEYLSKVRST